MRPRASSRSRPDRLPAAAASSPTPAGLLAVLAFALLVPLQAAESWALIEENFAYPDGPLAAGGSAAWRKQIGSTPTKIVGQVLMIGPGDGEESYITRPFAQLGLPTDNPPAIEALFSLRLAPVSGDGGLVRGAVGTVLQFTSGDGKQRRGRMLFRTLIDGTYQLGVSTKGSSSVVWSDRAFRADETYQARLVYNRASGSTRLWINYDASGAPGSPLVESTDTDAPPVTRVSVQCNAQHGPHRLWLDDLLVQPFGEIK